jgi:hypothetical protein
VDDYRHLVEILLPLYDRDRKEHDTALFARTRTELTERFGGMTAHMRAPARGLWKSRDGDVERDDIVIFEVVTGPLDREWWQQYRAALERRFAQDVILIRAMRIETI